MSAGPASRTNGSVRGAVRPLSILLLALAGGLVLAASGADDEELSADEVRREPNGTRRQIERADGIVATGLREAGGGSRLLDAAAHERAGGRRQGSVAKSDEPVDSRR